MTDFLKSLGESKNMVRIFPWALLVLCWIVYGNTLHARFMIDDYSIYTASELGEKNIGRYFIPDLKQTAGPGQIQKTAPTYRPLTKMIWTLTYRAFGNDPKGYHVFNILVFWLTCVALFFLLREYSQRSFLASATTLIFCVHPCQGLMMNNLPTILVSVEMMLMLLAMLCYKYSVDRPDDRAGWYALSFICACAVLLIHETAAAFPIYLICALVYGLGYSWRRAARSTAPFFAVSFFYFLFRLKFASLKAGLWDQARFFGIHVDQYLATLAKLIAWYFATLMSPSGLVMIWTTPVVRGVTFPYIAGLIVFLAILVWIFRSTKSPLVRWGIAWLAIGFLPVSMACLFRLSEGLCLETLWLVFPSVGYFLILGYWLDCLREYRRPIGLIALALFVLMFSITSRIYNSIWSDEKRYCFYSLKKAPAYRSSYFWLGTAFMRDGDYTLARLFLPLDLSSKVYNRQIFNNLGLMDFEERKWDSAEKNFLSAVRENPGHTLAYDYLGKIYLGRNDLARAAGILHRAIQVNPRDTVARLGLAAIAERSSRWEEALNYYQENLQIVPHDAETLVALLRFYISQHERSKMGDVAEEILLSLHDSAYLTATGEILAEQNELPLALRAFEQALLVNPKDKETYLSLGKLMGNMDRFDDAVRIWQEGAALDPQDPRFSSLIAQARVLQKKRNNPELIR